MGYATGIITAVAISTTLNAIEESNPDNRNAVETAIQLQKELETVKVNQEYTNILKEAIERGYKTKPKGKDLYRIIQKNTEQVRQDLISSMTSNCVDTRLPISEVDNIANQLKDKNTKYVNLFYYLLKLGLRDYCSTSVAEIIFGVIIALMIIVALCCLFAMMLK
jgi:hypothetical protein